MKSLTTTLIAFLLGAAVYAQDFHFSQFYNSPLLVNPAHTGLFRGDIRVSTFYKEQWRTITSPYTSFGVMGDMKVFDKRSRNTHLGMGMSLLKDVAGDVRMTKTQANFSLSGVVKVSDNSRLSAGIRSGLQQNSINTNGLKWGNQFDGQGYNGAIESNENISGQPYGITDFSTGVAYAFYTKNRTITSNDQTYFVISAAMHHVSKPQAGYQLGRDRLHHKYNLYFQGHFGIKNSAMAFQPHILYQRQGPNQELVLGGLMRYTIKEESKYTGFFKESAVSFGAHMRVGDAVIPAMNVEFKSFGFGLSYDVNISQLSTASAYNGGVEISFRFINPNPFKYGGGTQYKFGR